VPSIILFFFFLTLRIKNFPGFYSSINNIVCFLMISAYLISRFARNRYSDVQPAEINELAEDDLQDAVGQD